MRLLFAFTLAASAATPSFAQSATDAVIRVVDVGAGLCVVVAVPGGHAMLYDAGPGGGRCLAAAREMVPGRRFDLVVLSHSDIDHVREVPAILGDRGSQPGEFRAAVIIHPGDPRGPALVPVRNAISQQAARGTLVFNLFAIDNPQRGARPRRINPGDSFPIGPGRATFIAGWSNGNQTRGPNEDLLDGGPMNNALSIVIRFEYGGHSVLLTGDTVGRMQGDPASTCAYSERIMVSRASTVPIDSDILVGQHHGADNSTSTCFIEAVTPRFVVFSAGHRHRHPTQAAVDRLTARSLRPPVNPSNIFRTDRGDNERSFEMTPGSGRCPDPVGDDDVEIRLPRNPNAQVTVRYMGPSRGCGR